VTLDRTIRGFIVGPTGVGKTDVAIVVASLVKSEILNVDSRQIYRRLEIGTAKPTRAQRARIRHHLIDLLDPQDRCSAGRFVRLFQGARDDLAARSATGLAVGGAGLYVDACLGRFHSLPRGDEALRERYAELVRLEGYQALHARLVAIDPESAERLAPRDVQRVTRALEVAELTGTTMSERFRAAAEEGVCPPSTPVFHLTRPRHILYARIEARCRAMVDAGLPEEVKALLESGISPGAPGMKTVGYAEWGKWAMGECGRDEAFALFIRNSRRYAKRQETWFRNRHPERIEIEIEEAEPSEDAAAAIASRI
jgi:tRNA dimethylallyltransferase